MASLFDLGLQGYNAYQLGENYEDAQHDLQYGFDQARGDIINQQQPYTEFGLEHMQPYNDMGEFEYTHGDYLGSNAYNWLRDQGQQGIERSQAAKSQYFSGNTLADISEYNQNYAQTQYQQDWDRQHETYNTNRAYHQFPIETGAGMAENLGNNLADLSLGRGASMASLHASQAQALSRILSSTGAALSPTTGTTGDLEALGGIAGTVMDGAGNIIDQAGNFISNIWDGGGLDGNGDMGLLGDLGGLLTGNFGSSFDDIGDILQPGSQNEWDFFDMVDFEDISAEGINMMLNDDSWWDNFTQDIGSFGSDAWDNLTGWVNDFFQ